MTGPQADLTERARALVTEMQDACGIYHTSMIGRIAAFAAEARRAAIEECVAAVNAEEELDGDPPQAVIKVMLDDPPEFLRATVRATKRGIRNRIRALASPASKDDLEDDVKHGNAEYFRAALAHAAAEARRAAIVVLIEQGKAGLWYAVSDDIPGLLVSAVTREELEKAIPDAIAALKAASASPAPQEGW